MAKNYTFSAAMTLAATSGTGYSQSQSGSFNLNITGVDQIASGRIDITTSDTTIMAAAGYGRLIYVRNLDDTNFLTVWNGASSGVAEDSVAKLVFKPLPPTAIPELESKLTARLERLSAPPAKLNQLPAIEPEMPMWSEANFNAPDTSTSITPLLLIRPAPARPDALVSEIAPASTLVTKCPILPDTT